MAWPKGKKPSKETLLKISRYYSNPEVREKISGRQKKYFREHPEAKKRFAELSRNYNSNPANRKKMSELKKKQYQQNPGLIEKIDRTMTEWWHEHPNIKKERSIAIKNLFIKYPERFKKFLKYGKNPITLYLKTKQGFVVKSKGEQQIANFLFENKIKSLYEAKTLIFEKEGQICIPDFYLPKFKTYIEFYGGYPAAWKKKVMKNKLYEKYKIPCIFITPAELRNLDYYLIDKITSTLFKYFYLKGM